MSSCPFISVFSMAAFRALTANLIDKQRHYGLQNLKCSLSGALENEFANLGLEEELEVKPLRNHKKDG